jgi:hypothetical protein
LVVAVGFVLRRIVAIAWPVVAALAGWCAYNALRTGDPLWFYDAKRAWNEVDLVAFVAHPHLTAAVHLGVAAAAVTAVVLARRRLPTSWLCYTLLGLAPSLVFGVVGLARYAADSFPPPIAGAVLLERCRASTRRTVFAALVVAQLALAAYFVGIPRLI